VCGLLNGRYRHVRLIICAVSMRSMQAMPTRVIFIEFGTRRRVDERKLPRKLKLKLLFFRLLGHWLLDLVGSFCSSMFLFTHL
jgi:hypothetical protein